MANSKSRPSRRPARVKVRPAARKGSATSTTGPSRFRTFALPLFFSVCIVICLGALGVLGYQTVTASDFFNVAKIEVHGTDRASSGDVRRLVEMQTEKTGVWKADLPGIKEKVERMPWVKSAAVSRVLPGGIRVQVFERAPVAIVKTSEGTVLVDAEGSVIAPAREKEP
ncbi:MAG TPA: FtsQ-type POTRA domain-containing protein, partial [Pyrinomonadaceae bacterium]|nr:FtsQ-type POTRA domain-containing protein [Pyrinomonadaceae bacterium]